MKSASDMIDPGRGPYVQTFTGGHWYPFDPRPEDVRFEDLRAISRVSRYGGHHIPEFYSVAEHSVRVATLLRDMGAEPIMCLAGLLHDAHESYPPGDQLGPFLRAMRNEDACAIVGHTPVAFAGLLEIEHRAKWAVRLALGVLEVWGTGNGHIVKQADMTLLATEKRDLMRDGGVNWGGLPDPLPGKIEPWDSLQAWHMFDSTYHRISDMVKS